jgi:hypothetical protein
MSTESHLSDQDLLMSMDGELRGKEVARVTRHLESCWACRARKQHLETTIAQFVDFHRSGSEARLPSENGPAALLRAQLRQAVEEKSSRPTATSFLSHGFAWALVLAAILLSAATAIVGRRVWQSYTAPPVSVTVPNPSLTPGATIAFSRSDVCSQPVVNNKPVPATLRKAVFAEYGIPATQPEAYEVDYLITPALGGADDIHNLWPESSRATRWNALVKDALENHLRHLVCQGQIDLQTAQHEIASDWIEAYKKYFHTDQPLAAP